MILGAQNNKEATDMTMHNDANPEETKEWLDALKSVIEEEGIERVLILP